MIPYLIGALILGALCIAWRFLKPSIAVEMLDNLPRKWLTLTDLYDMGYSYFDCGPSLMALYESKLLQVAVLPPGKIDVKDSFFDTVEAAEAFAIEEGFCYGTIRFHEFRILDDDWTIRRRRKKKKIEFKPILFPGLVPVRA